MEMMDLHADFFRSKDLIAIYCNQVFPNNFLVGNILSSNDDCLLLSLIDPDSNYDGLCLCSTKYIFRIEKNSQYLQKLEKNYSFLGNQHYENDPWDMFLEYAEKQKHIIQVKGLTGKRIMFGMPISHSTDMFIVKRIHLDATWGHVFRIRRDKVSLLVCNSESEQELELALQKEEM